MPCDMCGADTGLVLAEIEGAKLNVCKNCASYGKILGRVRRPLPPAAKKRMIPISPRKKPAEPEWVLVKNYAERIRNKRESLGLKQKQMAQKIAEKESLLHKIETGSFKPGIDLARKIERILQITLLEKVESYDAQLPKAKGSALTLGDIIAVKKK